MIIVWSFINLAFYVLMSDPRLPTMEDILFFFSSINVCYFYLISQQVQLGSRTTKKLNMKLHIWWNISTIICPTSQWTIWSYLFTSVKIYTWLISCHFNSIINFNKFFWLSIKFLTTWKYINICFKLHVHALCGNQCLSVTWWKSGWFFLDTPPIKLTAVI